MTWEPKFFEDLCLIVLHDEVFGILGVKVLKYHALTCILALVVHFWQICSNIQN